MVGYHPEHLAKITPKAIHAGEVPKAIGTPAVTILKGDLVLAIFGAQFVRPGVYHVWGLVSTEVAKHPISFFKAAEKTLAWYERTSKTHRIQMDIRAGHFDLMKWAHLLGFRHEGIMRAYSEDRSDHYLYAKVVAQ